MTQKHFYSRAVMHAAAIAGSCIAITAANAQESKNAESKNAVSKNAVLEAVSTVSEPIGPGGSGGPAPRGEPGINCTIEGPSSCQLFEYPRVAGTSQDIKAAPIADQFKTAGGPAQIISTLCWWGTYGTACAAEPAASLDDYQIAYYTVAGTGVPGTQIARFRQSESTLTVTRRHICDVNARSSTEFTATHGPVTVAGGTCYFLEIRNFGTMTGSFWSRTFGGAQSDGYCMRDGDNDGYEFPAELINDDRAFCVGATLEQFGTPDCYVGGPPPPICANNNANGQPRGNINGGGFSNEGAGAVGLQLGDSVQFAAGGAITNVCFWGFWVAPDNTQPTGPGIPDFHFTIMDSDGTDGLPNTVLLTGTAGTTPGFTARRQGGNYNIVFPAFNALPNHCYYISIGYPQNNADPEHAYRFAWGLAQNNAISNNYLVSRPGTGGAWAYFNFGTDLNFPSNASWVFDQPAMTPSCGLPPPPPPPPANNFCANATDIGVGTFPIDNRGATTDGTSSCDPTTGLDVWYDFLAPCNGTFTATMCGTYPNDSILNVFDTNNCPALIETEIACDDDGCGTIGGPSVASFGATGGQHYLIRIGTFGASAGAQGTFTISRDGGPCGPTCPCDWNNNGVLNSQDFFDFLAAFFGGNADYNNNGITNSQDFFDFLACFFVPPAGC